MLFLRSITLFVDYLDVTFHYVKEDSSAIIFGLLLVLSVERSVVLEFFHYIGQTLSHILFKRLSVFQEARTLGIAFELVNFVPGLLAGAHISDIESSLTGLRCEDARLLGCNSSRRMILALDGTVDVRRCSEVVLLLGKVSRTCQFFMKICSKLRRFCPKKLIDRRVSAVGLNPWREAVPSGQMLRLLAFIGAAAHFSMRGPMMRRGQIPTVFQITLTQKCLGRKVHVVHP